VIPVDQTLFGVPGGNCFAACVASILELDIRDVPYFMEDDFWKPRFDAWLKPQGLSARYYAFGDRPLRMEMDVPIRGFYILHGTSPRGNHAVVANGRRIVHDPHPSRQGLISIREWTVIDVNW
jgi:hypothetical protein